jgi:hypothetical protein
VTTAPRAALLRIAALAGLAAAPASAQEAPEASLPIPPTTAPLSVTQPEAHGARPWPVLAAGGAAGGVIGAGASLYLAIRAMEGCEGGGCAIPLVMLPIAGVVIGTPAGVHLANARRGDFGETIGLSVLGMMAAGGVVHAINEVIRGGGDVPSGLLVIVPLGQIGGAILGERIQERRTGHAGRR